MLLLPLLGIFTLHIATTVAQLRVNGDRTISRVPRNVDDEWLEHNFYRSSVAQANFVSQTSLSKMVGIVSSDIVISSLGVSLSLSMVSLGAENATGEEFDVALGISSKFTIPSRIQAILNHLKKYKKFPLRVANVLFVSPHLQIQPEFSGVLEQLKLTAETVNFKSANDANEIVSEWCKTHTNERITNVLSSGDSNTAFRIMNTVYFKGTWLQKFVISATELRTFYSIDGTEKQVPSMAVTGTFLHGDLPEMEATFVQLPFKPDATDVTMNMFIILPKKTKGYSRFRMEFIFIDTSKFTSNGTVEKIYVELPKFKIASKIDFKEVVIEPSAGHNLSRLFDPREADFSGFATFPRLFLKEIVQASVIEINEEGCEAVSAMGCNNIEGFKAAPIESDSIDASKEGVSPFLVDHPFYALIATGSDPPLFVFGAWINGQDEKSFT